MNERERAADAADVLRSLLEKAAGRRVLPMKAPDVTAKEVDLRERRIWRSALSLCLNHESDCTCLGCCDIYAALEAWCSRQAEGATEP